MGVLVTMIGTGLSIYSVATAHTADSAIIEIRGSLEEVKKAQESIKTSMDLISETLLKQGAGKPKKPQA